jgi:hypothetical protein
MFMLIKIPFTIKLLQEKIQYYYLYLRKSLFLYLVFIQINEALLITFYMPDPV